MSARKSNALLWAAQGLLAALFLFAGAMKFIMPIDALQQGPVVLPVLFIRFIGVCEIAGALGLLLPGLLRIRRELTPTAAIGLVCIMAGAVTVTIEGGSVAGASVPFIVGALLAIIARGRSSWTSRPLVRA